jgi:hypothetical protein
MSVRDTVATVLTIHLESLARLCGDPFAVDVVDILLEEGGVVELQQSID